MLVLCEKTFTSWPKEPEGQDHQKPKPEEILGLSSDTQEILEANRLRPLWEVEDDFGNMFGDHEADI